MCFQLHYNIEGKKHVTPEQLAKFKEDLEAWKAKKLAQYDEDAAFAEKRVGLHVFYFFVCLFLLFSPSWATLIRVRSVV